MWLALTAEPDGGLALVATKALADGAILDKQPEDREAEVGVVRCPHGEVGVVEEVGCERDVADERLLLARHDWHRYKVNAEELVGVGEVVGSEQDRGLRAGSIHGLASRRMVAGSGKANLQARKHLLRSLRIIRDLLLFRLPPRRYSPQPKHAEGVTQRPPLGQVVLHLDVLRAQALARESDAAHNPLDGGLVDEVVEAELVGVLELELVIVGEEAEEREGLEDEIGGVGLVDELRGLVAVVCGSEWVVSPPLLSRGRGRVG